MNGFSLCTLMYTTLRVINYLILTKFWSNTPKLQMNWSPGYFLILMMLSKLFMLCALGMCLQIAVQKKKSELKIKYTFIYLILFCRTITSTIWSATLCGTNFLRWAPEKNIRWWYLKHKTRPTWRRALSNWIWRHLCRLVTFACINNFGENEEPNILWRNL